MTVTKNVSDFSSGQTASISVNFTQFTFVSNNGGTTTKIKTAVFLEIKN